MTNPAEVLTDEMIERVAATIRREVARWNVAPGHEAEAAEIIVRAVLRDERRVAHVFVVEIKDDDREKAAAWLHERLMAHEGVSIVPNVQDVAPVQIVGTYQVRRTVTWNETMRGLAAMVTAPED